MRSTDIAPNTFNRYAPVCVEGRKLDAVHDACHSTNACHPPIICPCVSRGRCPYPRRSALTGRNTF